MVLVNTHGVEHSVARVLNRFDLGIAGPLVQNFADEDLVGGK